MPITDIFAGLPPEEAQQLQQQLLQMDDAQLESLNNVINVYGPQAVRSMVQTGQTSQLPGMGWARAFNENKAFNRAREATQPAEQPPAERQTIGEMIKGQLGPIQEALQNPNLNSDQRKQLLDAQRAVQAQATQLKLIGGLTPLGLGSYTDLTLPQLQGLAASAGGNPLDVLKHPSSIPHAALAGLAANSLLPDQQTTSFDRTPAISAGPLSLDWNGQNQDELGMRLGGLYDPSQLTTKGQAAIDAWKQKELAARAAGGADVSAGSPNWQEIDQQAKAMQERLAGVVAGEGGPDAMREAARTKYLQQLPSDINTAFDSNAGTAAMVSPAIARSQAEMWRRGTVPNAASKLTGVLGALQALPSYSSSAAESTDRIRSQWDPMNKGLSIPAQAALHAYNAANLGSQLYSGEYRMPLAVSNASSAVGDVLGHTAVGKGFQAAAKPFAALPQWRGGGWNPVNWARGGVNAIRGVGNSIANTGRGVVGAANTLRGAYGAGGLAGAARALAPGNPMRALRAAGGRLGAGAGNLWLASAGLDAATNADAAVRSLVGNGAERDLAQQAVDAENQAMANAPDSALNRSLPGGIMRAIMRPTTTTRELLGGAAQARDLGANAEASNQDLRVQQRLLAQRQLQQQTGQHAVQQQFDTVRRQAEAMVRAGKWTPEQAQSWGEQRLANAANAAASAAVRARNTAEAGRVSTQEDWQSLQKWHNNPGFWARLTDGDRNQQSLPARYHAMGDAERAAMDRIRTDLAAGRVSPREFATTFNVAGPKQLSPTDPTYDAQLKQQLLSQNWGTRYGSVAPPPPTNKLAIRGPSATSQPWSRRPVTPTPSPVAQHPVAPPAPVKPPQPIAAR